MGIKEEALDVLRGKAHAIFGIDASFLNENTRFEEDLHCKSTNMVQFSAALEDAFEIEVPFMTIKKMKTFGEIAQWMEEQF